MYLTAQRVRSRTATGINIFLHKHGAGGPPVTSTGSIDIDKISTDDPGQIVDVVADVGPGGNDVLSYLDVAGDDDIDAKIIGEFIFGVEGEIAMANLPFIRRHTHAGLVLRFHALGLTGEQARAEYMVLCSRLHSYLNGVVRRETREPFQFRMRRSGEELVLTVDSASEKDMAAADIFPAAKSISASVDVVADMNVYRLSFLPHAIAALMNRDLHELVARGGVRVLDFEGKIVWERLPVS